MGCFGHLNKVKGKPIISVRNQPENCTIGSYVAVTSESNQTVTFGQITESTDRRGDCQVMITRVLVPGYIANPRRQSYGDVIKEASLGSYGDPPFNIRIPFKRLLTESEETALST